MNDHALDRTKLRLGYPDLRLFAYEHLPHWLQGVSKPFGDLARDLWENSPVHAETGVALRKLLEAKDAAVRSQVLEAEDATQRAVQAQDDLLAGMPDDAVAAVDDIG